MSTAPEGPAVTVRPGMLARNAVWLTGGDLVSRIIAFGVAIYLARVLGAEGFGQLGAALALVSYLLIVVDAGVEPYATREVARDRRRVPLLVTQVFLLRLVLATAMFAMLAFLVFILPAEAVGGRDLALVYGGTLFAWGCNSAWALRGRDEMRSVAVGLLVQHVFYAVGILVLVRGPDAPLVLVPVAHVAAELVRSFLYFRHLSGRYPRLRTSLDAAEGKRMVSESLPVALAKGLRVSYYQGDILLVTWLFAVAEAGYFLASHKIVLGLAMLGILYQQNAYPTLSRLGSTSRGVRFQDDVSRYALAFCVPVAVGGLFLSGPVIDLLYGAEYARSGPVLSIMLLSIPLLVVSAGFHNRLLISGRAGLVVRSEGLGVICHILLALLWIPEQGALGAAQASVAGRGAVLLLSAHYAMRLDGDLGMGARNLGVLAAGGIMGTVFLVVQGAPPVLAGIGATAAYAGALILLGGIRASEIRTLVRGLTGREEPPS